MMQRRRPSHVGAVFMRLRALPSRPSNALERYERCSAALPNYIPTTAGGRIIAVQKVARG
jgi:hypothetical protein